MDPETPRNGTFTVFGSGAPSGTYSSLRLLPQFAAPTLRHLTNAPDAYALGHTEYLDLTL